LEVEEHEDNLEKKEHQVFPEYPVVLELWVREVNQVLKDHLDHLEQMHWTMVVPEEMENQEFLDPQVKSDTQE